MIPKPKKGRATGTGKKNRGGRPPLADADRRETLVRVLTTEAEYGELQRAAAYAGMSVSTWLRVIALERARALVAEKEAARDRREQ
jgi:hypothetical protein